MTKSIAVTTTFFLSMLLICSFSVAQEVATTIKITDIRSTKGQIIISAFKDGKDFEKEQPFKNFTFDKETLVNGTLIVDIKLAPGTYGLTLVDDENSNGKMEKNMIGIPKEGFGFSNFFLTKMKKPVFDDFKVDLKANQNNVDIKVKYM